ncbi:uromodulin-like [Lissotriton helveticus]
MGYGTSVCFARGNKQGHWNYATGKGHTKPPDPSLQCLSGSMKLSVSRCQLEKSKFDSANLHLLKPSCTGVREVNGTALVVVTTTTSSTACGNILSFSADGSSVVYSNNLTIPGMVSPSGVIARQNYVYNFSCSYPIKNIPASLLTAIHPIVGSASIPLPGGVGSVSVLIYAFTDASFTTAYTESSTLKVQDLLYLTVIAPELNADDFSLRVDRLFVTGTSSATDLPQFDLITSGCPDSQNGDLATIVKNGDTTEAQFTVQVFKIATSDVLYFHASVEICEGKCTPKHHDLINILTIKPIVESSGKQLYSNGGGVILLECKDYNSNALDPLNDKHSVSEPI